MKSVGIMITCIIAQLLGYAAMAGPLWPNLMYYGMWGPGETPEISIQEMKETAPYANVFFLSANPDPTVIDYVARMNLKVILQLRPNPSEWWSDIKTFYADVFDRTQAQASWNMIADRLRPIKGQIAAVYVADEPFNMAYARHIQSYPEQLNYAQGVYKLTKTTSEKPSMWERINLLVSYIHADPDFKDIPLALNFSAPESDPNGSADYYGYNYDPSKLPAACSSPSGCAAPSSPMVPRRLELPPMVDWFGMDMYLMSAATFAPVRERLEFIRSVKKPAQKMFLVPDASLSHVVPAPQPDPTEAQLVQRVGEYRAYCNENSDLIAVFPWYYRSYVEHSGLSWTGLPQLPSLLEAHKKWALEITVSGAGSRRLSSGQKATQITIQNLLLR